MAGNQVMNLAEQKPKEQTTDSSVPAWFSTTHWSEVMLAGGSGSPEAAAALEKLCRGYWLPLYSYVRKKGYSPADAKDLTQGFFLRLLRMESLAEVNLTKGKFRTFLLASLNNFLSDERDHARAEKRGGGRAIMSLDETAAEQKYLQWRGGGLSPEEVYEKRWALTLLESAMKRLQAEYEKSGKGQLYTCLNHFLSNDGTKAEYEILAPELGMSPNSVPVAVHRLRQRYRECIRLELAQTVASPKELDEEMAYLFSVLSG